MAKNNRLKINVPDSLLKTQDRMLNSPSIEDGNDDGKLQGKIYTSDLTPDDKYSVNYTSSITAVQFLNQETGNFYVVDLHCSYSAELADVSATNPGLYGSELIKGGEPFLVIDSFGDYLRGIIMQIDDIEVTQTSSTVWFYDFKLKCMIVQGDPKKLQTGQWIVWKRQMYQDPSTFNEAYPPINLTSSFNKATGEIFFYWDDVNQSSKNWRLKLRNTNNTVSPFQKIIKVHGVSSNSDTALKPYVSGGDIKTIEIVEPGIGLNSNREVLIKGIGTGARWATQLDNEGSLMINSFEIIGGSGSTITLFSRKTKKEYDGYPIPNINSFISGLPPLGTTKNFYVGAVSGTGRSFTINVYDADTGLPIVITTSWINLVKKKEIKTHDGVYKIQTGSGYNYRTAANVKIIPNGVRAYWDPIFGVPTNSAFFNYSTNKTWAWSVSATYDEINKLYTEWTEEEYIEL